MNILLIVAAALSLFTFVVHIIGGGRTVAKPLLAAKDIDDVPKFTNYYCWHIVSLVLFAMTFSFFRSALVPDARDLGWLMTGLAAAFAIWSILLLRWKSLAAFDMPQWALFVPIALCGALGMLY